MLAVLDTVFLDDLVFSDQIYARFNAVPAHQSLRIPDLKYARIRVSLRFVSLILDSERLNEENWPSLHNFQLIFHTTSGHYSLVFGEAEIESQEVFEPSDPLAIGDIQEVRITFEKTVSSSSFDDDIVTFHPQASR